MQTIKHEDGTTYNIERRSSGRWSDLYFVYAWIKGKNSAFYSRVYATNEQNAIEKARAHYAQSLGLI